MYKWPVEFERLFRNKHLSFINKTWKYVIKIYIQPQLIEDGDPYTY